MARWTQKQQILAIVGGAALVCGLMVGGVFYAQGLIDEVEATAESTRQAIAAADAKIAQIDGLEKEVVILRENLGEYVKILPDTRELNDFVRMLDQFERQSGVVNTGLVPKPSRQAKGNERFAPIEYTYEMTGTLWECLKFVNLIENYSRFVNITEFGIASGDQARQENQRNGDVVHTMRLLLQTFTYNGKASGKEVEIPNYANRVEALREEIFKRMQNIKIEKYQLRSTQGRRDILVDPRLRGDLLKDGSSPAEQRAILERCVAETQALLETQQRMRRSDTTMFEQYALEKQLREGVEKLAAALETDAARVTYLPYRVRWAREVVAPFERIRGEVEQGGKPDQRAADPYLPRNELEQLVAQLQADCTAGQLEQAKSRFEVVAARLGVPAGDARHALAVAAKAIHVKATTALDFRSLDLRLHGVVVDRDGRSGVLINGQVYEEGEYVADDLLVKKVEQEQVWFVFRGLTLVRTM
ncbi:MAG: hypothetical protein FJ265_00520 [Planctomycetes bacterium]|nr:hypothetical protein [Planctomycetota bacterium]